MVEKTQSVAVPRRTPPRKSAHRWILSAIGLLLISVWILLENSPDIVSLPEVVPTRCDVIVVLGGEPNNRPKLASQLFQEGLAPVIIVSGTGDAGENAVKMARRGTPLDSMILEDESSTTFENARNTAPLLDHLHARRVILITSWFHARRARACFQHFRPKLNYTVVTTSRQSEYRYSDSSWAWQELAKTGYYWVRYGVRPL